MARRAQSRRYRQARRSCRYGQARAELQVSPGAQKLQVWPGAQKLQVWPGAAEAAGQVRTFHLICVHAESCACSLRQFGAAFVCCGRPNPFGATQWSIRSARFYQVFARQGQNSMQVFARQGHREHSTEVYAFLHKYSPLCVIPLSGPESRSFGT